MRAPRRQFLVGWCPPFGQHSLVPHGQRCPLAHLGHSHHPARFTKVNYFTSLQSIVPRKHDLKNISSSQSSEHPFLAIRNRVSAYAADPGLSKNIRFSVERLSWHLLLVIIHCVSRAGKKAFSSLYSPVLHSKATTRHCNATHAVADLFSNSMK
jgi:hypothetical protein